MISNEFARLRALWEVGLIGDAFVVARADDEISKREPRDMPEWLMDLSVQGPRIYWRRGGAEPWAADLPFSVEFAFRAVAVRLDDDESSLRFARWASRACMGEDLGSMAVRLGYLLDHDLDDCDRPDRALDLLRQDLPALLPDCWEIVEEWLPGGEGGRQAVT